MRDANAVLTKSHYGEGLGGFCRKRQWRFCWFSSGYSWSREIIQTDLNVQFGFAPASAFTGDGSTLSTRGIARRILIGAVQQELHGKHNPAVLLRYCSLCISTTRKPNQMHTFLDNLGHSAVQLLGTWFYEQPYCYNSDMVFPFLPINVLIVGQIWMKASAKRPRCKSRIIG